MLTIAQTGRKRKKCDFQEESDMEIRVNKEIQDYKEAIFMGLLDYSPDNGQ